MGQVAKQLKQEIMVHHEAAVGNALASRQRAADALRSAHRCGQLLEEARTHCGHGEWDAWCRAALPSLSRVTIWRYRKLAKDYPELPEVADADSLRQAYLRLGIVAERSSETASTKRNASDTQLAPSKHGLTAANQLLRWLHEKESAKPFSRQPEAERRRLQRDLRPLYESLRRLFDAPADPPGKESLSGGRP